MELTPQEKGHAFWSGAGERAFSGIGLGIAVAIGAGALLLAVGAFTPAAWGLGALFGLFITLPGVALPFFPLPLIAFNTALTIVSNVISGGNSAIDAYRQEKIHAQYEMKLNALEGREQYLESCLTPQRSMVVDSIIQNGPRPPAPHAMRPGTLTIDSILRDGPGESHAATEEARDAAHPGEPTLH